MVKFSDFAEKVDKEANRYVPEGVYDVVISDVVRRAQPMRPDSLYTVISFDIVAEGEIPPIYVNSAMVGTRDDKYTKHMAKDLTLQIYLSVCVNPDDLGELDEEDPMFDGLRRLIGASMRVIVEKNPKTGKMQSVPLPPGSAL